jgi:CheY-like chemotaxis protein/nucleoid DNA-binding protein
MKYLIIDGNKQYAEALCEKLSGEIISLQKEIVLTAKEVVNQTENNKEAVILINTNLIAKENRQSHEGITLLKWIRLKGCNSHCILYSFQALYSIVKANPLNSILLSKGVSFLQLPLSLQDIETVETSEKAERENLLPYFRAEVDLVRIRHELANLWAIHRMKEVIGIDKNEENKNYYIEILKYLSADLSKPSILNNETLLNQIKTFQAYGKKIFYYDDLADDWALPLKNLFGDKNIEIISAKTVNQNELLDRIQKENPGCLLLDLRLANEKDALGVLEYSGGKVLQEVKKRFITLPVIMFTATNKAESVRRLLSAGAEYVWTKEGVDDGINEHRTLENIETLLMEVQKSLGKFKNKHYEAIFIAECNLISPVNTTHIRAQLESGPLKHVKYIYFDSNYLINSIQDNYLHLFFSLLYENKQLTYPKKIVIHADVLNEIITIGKQDENVKKSDPAMDRNNPYRVPVCRFLMDKIIRWKQEKLVFIDFKGGQEENIDDISKLKIPYGSAEISIDEIEVSKQNLINQLSEYEEINKEQLSESVNIQFEKIKNLIAAQITEFNKMPDFSTIRLHADNTFTKIIPKSLDNGGVIFVSDDNKCAYYVGETFKSSVYKDQQSRTVGNVSILKETKLFKGKYYNIYKHYYGNQFNKLLIPNTP